MIMQILSSKINDNANWYTITHFKKYYSEMSYSYVCNSTQFSLFRFKNIFFYLQPINHTLPEIARVQLEALFVRRDCWSQFVKPL